MPSQMMTPGGQLIKPGPSLIEGARAIDNPKNVIGSYPYQWLFPGPHSRMVLANAAIALTGPGLTDDIVRPGETSTYTVPDGMTFSLRGVVIGAATGSGWNEGDPAAGLFFSLKAIAAGIRYVDFLRNVNTHLGSLESPYPILGRLEFAPLTALTWQVQNIAGPAAGKIVFAHLVGHLYPQSEGAV